MKIQFIKAPTKSVFTMLARRAADSKAILSEKPGGIGLVQGALADMIAAADMAEKASDVWVEEIRGICPQHFTMIAIFGDIADVESALQAISQNFKIDGHFN